MTNKSHYRPEIDGLRALAILPVLFYHYNLGFPGGYVGVDVFFVISGYLISGIIVREMKEDRFSLTSFWERRIRRIFPPLFAMVIGTLILGWFLFFPTEFIQVAQSALYQSFFASNFYFWDVMGGYFTPWAESLPLLHTWSLSIEEQFYLIIPLVFVLIYREYPKSLRTLVVLIFIITLAISEYGLKDRPQEVYLLLHGRAWELLMGVLLVLYRIEKPIPIFWREFMSWVGLACITFAVFVYTEQTPFPGFAAFVPCLGTALIIQSNEQGQTSLGKLLSFKPIVAIGLISYSLYLWHWPLYSYAAYFTPFEMTLKKKVFLIGVSVVLAVLSWKFVENPFRHKRFISQQKMVFISGFCLAGFTIFLSSLIIQNDGFKNRMSDEVLYLQSEADAAHWEDFDESLPMMVYDKENPTVGLEPKGDQLDFVVWGDSHAWALFPMLDELAKEHQLSGKIIARGGYAPIRNVWVEGAPIDDNPRWREESLRFIEESGARHVIIIARWELYLQYHERLPYQYQLTDVAGKRTSYDDSYELMKKYFPETLQFFEERGIKVTIMRQTPEQRGDMPKLLGKAMISNSDAGWMYGTGISQYEYYTRRSNEFLSTLESSNVNILDPIPLIYTDEGEPILIYKGRSVFRDHDHISLEGSFLLKPLYEPVFDEIEESKKMDPMI